MHTEFKITLTELFGWYVGLDEDEVDCKLCGARVKMHNIHQQWHITNENRIRRIEDKIKRIKKEIGSF